MCDVISSNPVWVHFRHRIEDELEFWKSELAPLEKGELHVGERLGNGQWVDVTPAMIAAHKRSIATLEDLLSQLQKATR